MTSTLTQVTTIVFTTDTGLHCRTVIRKPYTASAPSIEIAAKLGDEATSIVLDESDNLRTIFRFPIHAICLAATLAKHVEHWHGDSDGCYEIIREGVASLLLEFSTRGASDMMYLGRHLQGCIIADCTIEIMG